MKQQIQKFFEQFKTPGYILSSEDYYIAGIQIALLEDLEKELKENPNRQDPIDVVQSANLISADLHKKQIVGF